MGRNEDLLARYAGGSEEVESSKLKAESGKAGAVAGPTSGEGNPGGAASPSGWNEAGPGVFMNEAGTLGFVNGLDPEKEIRVIHQPSGPAENPETLFASGPGMEGDPVPVDIYDGVHIALAKVPLAHPFPLIAELKALATFKNPAYAMALRYDRPLPKEFFEAWEMIDDNILVLPKGDLRKIIDVFHRHGVAVELQDRTREFPLVTPVAPIGHLPERAGAAFSALSGKRYGVLIGGQGEDLDKVVACHLIYTRGQRALIVVKRKWQLYLWKKMLMETGLAEGRIGLVGDGHKEIRRDVTVGIDRSLYQFTAAFHDAVGFLIVDTCDVVNVKIFFRLVWRIPCRYLLGIATHTARKDRLTEMMHLFLGRAKAMIPPPDAASGPGVTVVMADGMGVPSGETWDDVVSAVCDNGPRLGLVFAELLRLCAEGLRVLVTGPRIRQLQELQARLMKNYRHAEVVYGQTPEREISRVCSAFVSGEVQVVGCTTTTLGALPATGADAVVVAGPFKSYETAAYLSKQVAAGGVVYDFTDDHPLIRRAAAERMGFYRKMGFMVR